jgi:diguanylate cyclase (GGDEF)-like protein
MSSAAAYTSRRPLVVSAVATVLVALVVLPFCTNQWGPSVSFMPALIVVVAGFDLLSVYLLVGDYRDRGDVRLLVMACAYTWSLIVMGGYALSFPGAIAMDPPLAVTASMAPYFYVIWHGGFPLLLGCAWAPWPARWGRPTPERTRTRMVWVLVSVFAASAVVLVAALVLLAARLPVLIVGLDTSRMTTYTAPIVLPLVMLALVATVYGTWHRTGPERWSSVAVLVCVCDLVLTYMAGSRFSVGWYGGRTLTLVAAAVVLLAMLASFRRLKAQAEHDAMVDSLTGLLNRRGGYLALDQMVARARRTGASLGVVAFDLDWFKRVNDRHGHEAGDEVLAEVGRSLATLYRRGDVGARVGGEEFLLLLHDTDAEGARAAAERVRELVASMRVAVVGEPVTASVGVSVFSPGDANESVVLRRADHALYEAKRLGRNRVETAFEDLAAFAA